MNTLTTPKAKTAKGNTKNMHIMKALFNLAEELNSRREAIIYRLKK